MKIKKYNKFKLKYKYNIGDYVLLDLNLVNKEYDIIDDNGNFKIESFVLIYEIRYGDCEVQYYDVHFSNMNGCLIIRESNIIRLLTKKEIEEYKVKQELYKYNI